MRRSTKSAQRGVRQLHFVCNAAGTAVTGLDSLQVSLADTGVGIKTITLSEGFAAADYVVQVTVGTADTTVDSVVITNSSTFVITTVDATDGVTDKDAICYVSVIGSDVSDRY